jgi:hypothetical protein
MVKITGPIGPEKPQLTTPIEGKSEVAAKPAILSATATDDGMSKAASGLLGYKSSPLVSGAIKIFGDGIIFPANLTDPNDPRNDPKYLRLLAAVLGMDELERHFHSIEGKEQEEYLERKAKQRENRMAKVEREKEEKNRQKEDPSDEVEEKDDTDE